VYAAERQAAIVDRARVDGRVEVTALAEMLDVTAETVRRDLTELERQGVLKRVHGGAIPIERLGYEPPVSQRETELPEEKLRIAKAALSEVPQEGAIALDAGTTTLRLAELLPVDRELNVVTNGLSHAMLLSTRPNLSVHLVGGRIRPRTLATVDVGGRSALEDLFVDVAFLGANGISVEHGLTTPDRSEASTKQALIRAAGRTVVLADHSKFGVDHFATFGTLAEVDAIVTDAGIEAGLAADVEAAGPRVIRA